MISLLTQFTMTKIICTKQDTGKRILVDTVAEPNYKEVYNDESGAPFCSKPPSKATEIKVPKIEAIKPKKKKVSKKSK